MQVPLQEIEKNKRMELEKIMDVKIKKVEESEQLLVGQWVAWTWNVEMNSTSTIPYFRIFLGRRKTEVLE